MVAHPTDQESDMSLEEQIAERVAGFAYDRINADLLYLLKRNILDSYAGICGSLKDKAMLANFDRLAAGPASGKDLDVWGIGRKAAYLDAFFMNAILARRSDLLNTYIPPNGMGGAHPSDNVALVLTLADWLGMDGRAVLTSTYTAFYLSAAFTTYFNDLEAAGYDHDAAATLYTALIIGHALGMPREQLVSVQRIAGSFGLDINQTAVGPMTDWKHCTYASCVLRGLEAVKLARAGFEAASEIYEGAAGINRFLPHAEAMFDPPPALERIIFKRWPALVFCQTPIDVAIDVATKIPDKNAIRSISVKTYAVAARNGATAAAWHPTTRAGRTHSIPYCVATALLKPSVAYEDFDEPHASDQALTSLMAKIAVAEDPGLSQAYPAKSGCVIEVTLEDGSTVRGSRDYPKGDPNDPLSDGEIEDKLRQYFFFASGPSEVGMIIDRLWTLDQQTDLDWLTRPLKRRMAGLPAAQAANR
jgi:2-methylcitrate dehydratase